MAALRIGVNALYLIPGGVGGTEIYLRCLLAALAKIDPLNHYVLFTNRETGEDLIPPAPNFQCAPERAPGRFRPARLAWEQTLLPLAVKRRRLDVLFNPGFTAPVLCSCPSVTVFHDLQHQRHPEYFRWFDLPFWRVFLFAAAHRSTLLLADSEATRRDLLRFYRLPEQKVRVVPLGVDETFFELGRQRRELEPYLLCVSTLHPHKNLERLVRMFAEFRRRRPEFSLVIAGLRGFHAAALETLVAELELAAAVRLTGWIPRSELLELYRRAFACVCPSTFEGFGMPVLEALAAGVPTACSAIEPLSSLAGDAALQFDPLDEAALQGALERLVSDGDLRARLAAAGPPRAAQFPWHRTAELTLAALREAAAGKQP
jgi:glycosyltransferase involved in cell wall biosynthesis